MAEIVVPAGILFILLLLMKYKESKRLESILKRIVFRIGIALSIVLIVGISCFLIYSSYRLSHTVYIKKG